MTPQKLPPPNPLMMVYKSLAGNFITNDIAIEIVRMVFLNKCGEVELNRNLPFVVTEDEERWIVTGTHNKEYNGKYPMEPSWGGPVRMEIAKFDGQILVYTFGADLPWAKVPPNPGNAPQPGGGSPKPD